jgi:glutamate---cysteine ligase / carboxylate-amine ligase
VNAPELLVENRFIASRDGIEAELIDPERGCRVPARELLGDLRQAVRTHAAALGCEAELAGLDRLVSEPGAERQRQGACDDEPFKGLVRRLAGSFLD